MVAKAGGKHCSFTRLRRKPRLSSRGAPILLQLIGDAFGVAGQFHIALSMGGPPLNGASRLDGAFPIGDLCAAFGCEFLLGHEWDEFE